MPHSNNLCYEFGPFKLNVRERLLTRHGEAISLTPKSADILLVLLKNAGELVDKETLMTEVWPESFVEEANLTQNVFQLRRTLGDHRSRAQYIETVARRGYRFVATVKVVEGTGHKPDPLSQTQHGAVPNTISGVDRAPRLAVIPFVNATGNQNLEYLAEGVSDNIINSLSQISKLRVMSRSAVFRFKGRDVDPALIAKELRIDAMLLGKITSMPSGLMISAELVDVGNGWQLWGKSFECELSEIVEIQHEIVRQISRSLKVTLTGDEEKRITARYTENPEAYQAYLEGRFHWSRYTRDGIEQAIQHFCKAIEFDPNYALAYSGVIDCYLRLATNYLPPESSPSSFSTLPIDAKTIETAEEPESSSSADLRVKLRHEWDWRGAERELRRANELKFDYPAAHQWHAAFLYVRQQSRTLKTAGSQQDSTWIPSQIRSTILTQSEEVQVYCAIAREQLVIGNFEGASLVLDRWLPRSGWPKLAHLDPHIAADLLFTLGTLIAALSLTGQMTKGHKRAESYLSGAIALFEQLGKKIPAAEAQMDLARCFYREGFFDDAKEMLTLALAELPGDQTELISLCLSIYGCVERDSGRLWDSLSRLEAASLQETGQLVTGYRHLQIATTLKELGNSESRVDFYEEARQHFRQALYEFEAIGNHRNTAATENNYGYLLLWLGLHQECEFHLLRARQLFNNFCDPIRAAQVNETLTHLYLALNDLSRAQESIDNAVATLEASDGAALLAEALITKGVVACRHRRYDEARKCFEGGYRVAEQCGDNNSARRALLTLSEEMGERIEDYERSELKSRLQRYLNTQQTSLLIRMERVLKG